MKAIVAGIRHTLRSLRQSPAFTFTAVAAMALGIAANTSIFTIVETVVLRPLPFAGSGRAVSIGRPRDGIASVSQFSFWQRNNPGFDDLAASLPTNSLNLNGGDEPELVSAVRVSRSFFHLFGAHAILGRTFSAAEDSPGGTRALVLSYGTWQQRFGGDPAIVGHAIRLGGAPATVVGVIEPGFLAYPAAEVWLPLQADPQSRDVAHVLQVFARLPAGTTLAQANAQMAAIGKRYVQVMAATVSRGDDRVLVLPEQERLTGAIRPSLAILMGAVGLVLLIACANVANLLLARAAGRRKEIAIRAALGAGRGQIVRQLLTESLLLAGVAGVLGLGLAAWGVRALIALAPADLPRLPELAAASALNPRVAAFTLLMALATGVLFGLAPAMQVSRADLVAALKESGGRATGGGRQTRTRSLLVASEVALAVVLLCGAGLLIRSFAAMQAAALGFDSRNLLTIEVSLAGPGYATSAAVERIGREFVDRAERIPGVESAALASALPLFGEQDMLFAIPGKAVLENGERRADVQWRLVTPDYFRVLRIPLLSGRLPRDSERARTAVISQSMARKYWPHADPVGQSIVVGAGLGPEYEAGPAEIVGLVGDVRARLDVEPAPTMYQLPAQAMDAAMALVNRLTPAAILVRTRPGVAPMSVSREVRQALIETDRLPVAKIRDMRQLSRDSISRQNFNLLLLALFAAMALVLAAVGIYGVMSYAVAQRTHEIGIRGALGATRGDMLRLVLRQALAVTLAGIAAGLAASFGLTRLLSAQLYGVRPIDPITFAAVPVILAGVALAAAAVPARRATRVDPLAALRHE